MSKDLIELALKELKCNQKELAKMLEVSQTQITKWKAGEYMSWEAEEKLTEMLNLDGLNASLVLKVHGVENAKVWTGIINYIVHDACENSESGYNMESYTLIESELMATILVRWLVDSGFKFEQELPDDLKKAAEMIPLYESGLEDVDYEDIDNALFADLRCRLIRTTLSYLDDLYGFYSAFIYSYSDEEDLYDKVYEIETLLLDVAFLKMSESEEYFASNEIKCVMDEHRRTHYNIVENNLNDIKRTLIASGRPYAYEITGITCLEDFNELGAHAEVKSYGLTENKYHPDMYMNELIHGNRLLHAILPLICEKLDISDEDMRKAIQSASE